MTETKPQNTFGFAMQMMSTWIKEDVERMKNDPSYRKEVEDYYARIGINLNKDTSPGLSHNKIKTHSKKPLRRQKVSDLHRK